MRAMVLVKATEDSGRGLVPTPESKEAMETLRTFNDELRAAGILRFADGLTPSSRGKRIAFECRQSDLWPMANRLQVNAMGPLPGMG